MSDQILKYWNYFQMDCTSQTPAQTKQAVSPVGLLQVQKARTNIKSM